MVLYLLLSCTNDNNLQAEPAQDPHVEHEHDLDDDPDTLLEDDENPNEPQQARPNPGTGREDFDIEQVDADADWEGGVQLTGTPFLAARLIVVAAPGVTIEARLPDGERAPVSWTMVEGNSRVAEVHPSAPTESITIWADGPVEWAQLERYEDGIVYDDQAGTSVSKTAGRAIDGMWTPADKILAIGKSIYLPYQEADHCTGTTQPGTLLLAEFLVENTEATAYGTYACRAIVGGTSLSVHSEGRAIDLFVPLDGGLADNDLGDPIAAWLIEHAEDIGISLIIWDEASWGAHRSGSKHKAYGGAHPHHDHLHIELTDDGAAMLTRWFSDMTPFEGSTEGWIDIASTDSGDGYWMAHSDGTVLAFGDANHHGDPFGIASTIVGIASAGDGYCLTSADGGVFCYGEGTYRGSMGSLDLVAPMVDITMLPDNSGYILVGENGGVFAFGDARFHGATLDPEAPIVGITTTDNGYWMVDTEGALYAFGDAVNHGSMSGTPLNDPINQIESTPSGNGYWMFAEDGGVFTFGDAGFYDSLGGMTLAEPVRGGTPTPSGEGYWMVAQDGGVFALGDATYLGNAFD